MRRIALFLCLAALLSGSTVAWADDLSDRWGGGFEIGLYKLVGGEKDYSNVDQLVGLWLRRGLTPHWSFDASIRYGYTRPGALAGEDAGFTFDSVHAFYTQMIHGMLGARYHFAPDNRLVPYFGLHAGYIDLRVRDENGVADFGFFPDGDVLMGYDTEGRNHTLVGQYLTGTASLGLEFFLGESVTFDLGARYTQILGNDMDNVGSGNLWGPGEIDANTGLLEAFFGMTLYLGGESDNDQDGILNDADACPDEAEDVDGFQDADGCPDPDNDADGLLDGEDACPNDAEDRDGFKDEDGCPDPDNDGDGVIDAGDQCPDQAEDIDGFQDDDGCPDPDNDGDGVDDATDRCEGTPAGVEVDATGCPVVADIREAMVLKGVTFKTSSSELESSSVTVLNQVAESLKAWPNATIEIQGHTDSSGSAEANRNLSMRRAEAVREFFVGLGIDPGRMTAVGYGEDLPLADNSTSAGRAANRRVELVRTDQ